MIVLHSDKKVAQINVHSAPSPCRSVTIERYFAIVHPLKHFSAKKFLLLASVVAALLYNVPKFYEFEKKVGLSPTDSSKRVRRFLRNRAFSLTRNEYI